MNKQTMLLPPKYPPLVMGAPETRWPVEGGPAVAGDYDGVGLSLRGGGFRSTPAQSSSYCDVPEVE